jgi:DNA-binding winged helix-turn-helix (wHTH) protein/tetratricopeptide (TPR) repeat protein
MPAQAGTYRFGPYALDTVAFRLYRTSAPVPLSPKIADLLLYLLQRPSTLVTKEELFAALWPDVAVTDNALTQAVSELRQVLGDDASTPTYIQTVARRGYRFVAPVAFEAHGAAPSERAAPAGVARTIAVTDFTNVSGDPDYAWLSTGIAETVTNDLRTLGALKVIDRIQAAEVLRGGGGSLAALDQSHLARLAVVGSFQRMGDRLRITARVVDVASGETVADAKIDGLLSDVFELQDRLVAQFAGQLGLAGGVASERRLGVRETSSLEAYQAFTEGRVKLESLEVERVPHAIADFERALGLDPRYALAEVGLANAWLWRYEASRAHNQPDAAALAAAVDHARRAIEIDKDLAEGHATLAFILVSAGRAQEALAAARRAVALEPGYWANQFRLGHAAWGEERLRAYARTLELYPDFPFVHFGMAMVHIARGDLDQAEPVLREGAVVQDRQHGRRQRFPACGLHWLLGLTRLARGDVAEAIVEFERELRSGGPEIYAAEFAMDSYDGLGFAHLAEGRHDRAIEMFGRALERYPRHARSAVGLAAAHEAGGRADEARACAERALQGIQELERSGRACEALLVRALDDSMAGRPQAAIEALERMLTHPVPPFAGWTVPVEPLLRPLHDQPGFERVRARLADLAR